MKFTLYGRIPSKKNSRINTRSGRSFPSKKYTEWHNEQASAIEQLKLKSMKSPIGILIAFYMPDNRRCDLTNKAESIMDLLVDCDILEDDCWQCVNLVALCCNSVDKENSRCEITIG